MATAAARAYSDSGKSDARAYHWRYTEARGGNTLDRLQQLIESPNIAEDLSETERAQLGAKVTREFDVDKQSRKDWETTYDEAMKLAKQVTEKKNYPWPNAANIKYPLITTAAIQFAARAYPAIVSGPSVVKGKVRGEDPDGQKRERADRVARHMSYQLLEEMEDWEDDTDTLLHVLPIVGCAFRKTFFDQALGRNCSQLVLPEDLVVHNDAKGLNTAPRVTQVIELYPHEVTERIRDGRFVEIVIGRATESDPNDDDAPHVFLEQHRLEDLDEDGYPEPYIVTVHKETRQVARVVARFDAESVDLNAEDEVVRITPVSYFTKYSFIPSLDGSFYDIGFGALLRGLGEAINTTVNQMLDAGHLANTGGGFIGAGLRIKGGAARFRPGEYKRVNATGTSIRDNVVPLTFPGPSAVLFTMLELLIEAARDITSVKDVMTGGEGPAQEAATRTLARIEQGMKVFSAIYKRVFRSLRDEYRKLYRLNRLFLEPQAYFQYHDEPQAVAQQDYEDESLDVAPAADPQMVTEMQRLVQAEFLMGFMADPYMDPKALRERIFTNAGVPDHETLMVEQPAPNPEIAAKADEIEIRKRELEYEGEKAMAQVAEIKSKIILNLAKAEEVSDKREIESLKTLLDTILRRQELALKAGQADDQRASDERKADIDSRRLPSVAGASRNAGGS